MADRFALRRAVQSGQRDLVESLIDKGVSISDRKFGQKLLRIACNYGCWNTFRLLLDRGVNISSTILIFVLSRCHVDVLEMLLSHKACPSIESCPRNLLHMAASKGHHHDKVKMLLHRGFGVNVIRAGETPLFAACKRNHRRIAETLLNYGAAIDALCGRVEYSPRSFASYPLGDACYRGHQEIVELLLDRGANAKEVRGSPCALSFASLGGQIHIMAVLLSKGVGVNGYPGTWSRFHPIYYACLGGHRKAADFLLANHASFELYEREELLEHVCYMGYVDVLRLLIELKTPLGSKFTLEEACAGGHRGVVEILLNSNVEINNTGGRNRLPPLHAACKWGHYEVVKLLLDRGAKINSVASSTGQAPLFIACLHRHREVIELLILRGADVNQAGEVHITFGRRACRTPLELIFDPTNRSLYAGSTLLELARTLLSAGAAPVKDRKFLYDLSFVEQVEILYFPMVELWKILWMSIVVGRAQFKNMDFQSFMRASVTTLKFNKAIGLMIRHGIPWTIIREILIKTVGSKFLAQ